MQIVSNSVVGTFTASGGAAIRLVEKDTTGSRWINNARILNNIISVGGGAGTDSCIEIDDQSTNATSGVKNLQVVANSCGVEVASCTSAGVPFACCTGAGAGANCPPENCMNVKNISEDANWIDVRYDANIFDDCTTYQSGGTLLNVTPERWNNGGQASWRPRTGPEEIRTKTADESVTSSAVLQDDDHLAGFSIPTGKYVIDGLMTCTSASATPDIKLTGVVGTSTVNNLNITYSIMDVAAAVTANQLVRQTSSGTSSGTIPIAAGGVIVIRIAGAIDVTNSGTTAGTFKIQWSQDTSNATATTCHRGSYLRLMQTTT